MAEDEKRHQQRTALICATVANFAMKSKRSSKKYKLKDFMPKERKEMTDEQMYNEVVKLNRMFGGTVTRKPR